MFKNLKKHICLFIILALISGCSANNNVTNPNSLKFVNDLKSREELYKEYPAEFDNPEYQSIADDLYLTFAKRGTQEPEPVINVDDRGYIKPLGDGYYLFFEIETYDDFKSGKNKLVDEEGNMIICSPYTEFIYYDENGKAVEVKYDDLEDDIQFYYSYYIDMLGNSKMKYEYYSSNSTKIQDYYKEQGNSNIYHIDSVTEYTQDKYEFYSIWEYKNGLLLSVDYNGYKQDYNHINKKIYETIDYSSTYKYYNGFVIQADYWDDNKNTKVNYYYDNNGLGCMEEWFVDDEYQKTVYYVYDFENAKKYKYNTDGELFVYELGVQASNVFPLEIYSRIGFKYYMPDFEPKTWYIYTGLYEK